MNNVAVVNHELVVTTIGEHSISDTLLSLITYKSSDKFYFNKKKWFSFFEKYMAHFQCVEYFTSYEDYETFLTYEKDWREYFLIKDENIFVENINKFVKFKRVLPRNLESEIEGFNSENINNFKYNAESFLQYWMLFTSSKKSLKNVYLELSKYENLIPHLLYSKDYLQKVLSFSYKDYLIQINKYLGNESHYCFFQNLKLIEQIEVLSKINYYKKKHGSLFLNFIGENNKINLHNIEEVDKRFKVYLFSKNKLLSPPLKSLPQITGGWKLYEINSLVELHDEATTQKNCLFNSSTYRSGVTSNTMRIFSFRKKIENKEIRYSVCYMKNKSTNKWKVFEEGGLKNSQKRELFDDYNHKLLEYNMELVKHFLNKINLNLKLRDDIF